MNMPSPRSARKTLLAGSIGNMLEWYDFALYGYFAPVFAVLFFPSEHPSISLLSAFGVFAVGFLARPLGAMLFGYWGDTVGRRETLAGRLFSWPSRPVASDCFRRLTPLGWLPRSR